MIAVMKRIKMIGFIPLKITVKDIFDIDIKIPVETIKKKNETGLLARKIATIYIIDMISLVLGSIL
jgi:hypothetical protein